MWYISIVVFLFTFVFFYLLFKDLKKEDIWNKMYVGNFIQIRTGKYSYEKCVNKKIIGKTETSIKIQHFGVFNKSEFFTKLKYDCYHGNYYLKM